MSLWWGDFKGLYFAGKYLTRLRNKSTGFVRFFALFLQMIEGHSQTVLACDGRLPPNDHARRKRLLCEHRSHGSADRRSCASGIRKDYACALSLRRSRATLFYEVARWLVACRRGGSQLRPVVEGQNVPASSLPVILEVQFQRKLYHSRRNGRARNLSSGRVRLP
jgi:hypothetical protein